MTKTPATENDVQAAAVPEPTVWPAKMSELYAWESDIVMAELGMTDPDTMTELLGRRAQSVLAVTAVVMHQRLDPSMPISRWRTLRMKDLDPNAGPAGTPPLPS